MVHMNFTDYFKINKKNGFTTISFQDEHIKKYYNFPSMYTWKEYIAIANGDFDKLQEYENKGETVTAIYVNGNDIGAWNPTKTFDKLEPRKKPFLKGTDLVKYLRGIFELNPKAKIINAHIYGINHKGSSLFPEEAFNEESMDTTQFLSLATQLYLGKTEEYCISKATVTFVNKTNSKRKRTHIPRGMRHEVFKRDDYRCVECGATKSDGATLHVDHIVPVAKGGTDELSNLQTLCSDCNLNKNDMLQGEAK